MKTETPSEAFSNDVKAKKWYKPAINGGQGGCLCCPSTAALLPLKTKLYYGFGGWSITKNGKPFFTDNRDVDFEKYKDLKHVEKLIGEDLKSEYRAIFDSPLRGATYQRHAKNSWVLIDTNEGFA